MKTYQRYNDFSAQGINVRALMALYADMETGKSENKNLVPIVVFTAFSIESYLNSLGARKSEIWEEIERLPWKTKVEILHKISGNTPNWGAEPLQFATEVFKLRDKLAHGRPERVNAGIVSGPTVYESHEQFRPQPEWFVSINEEWAMHAKRKFHELMVYLGNLFGLHESDHLEVSTMVLVPVAESAADA